MSKTVTVKVIGDTLDELDERFLVKLSDPKQATLGNSQGAGTIDDDDAALSIDDVAVIEGNSGTTNAKFTVSLSTASDRQVTVDYGTADDTATAPSDYTAVSGTVTFAAGDTSEPVTVSVKGEGVNEPDERFFVNLANPQQATLADNRGIGTITDDDTAATSPAVSIDDTTVTEGSSGELDATFTISLSAATTTSVAVDYATADDTATAPADFTATSGTVNFAAGETSETVTVKVRGDTRDEPDERFFVNLTNPRQATLADAQGIGTITDDDAPPGISVTDASVTEGDVGDADATFTVSLSASSSRLVRVDVKTANDSATAPADYTEATSRLAFLAGETSKTVTVKVRGDTLDEPDERFLLNLSGTENASIADAQGVGTIADDDPTPAGSPAPPAQAPDTTRPLIGALSLSRTRFRAAGSGPSIATALGARVSYALSEPASVRFRVERALSGRRVRGRCVRTTRTNRRARSCTRYSVLRGGFAHNGKAGQNAFKFSGRLNGRKLAPGRYRLRGLATDKAGNKSLLKRTGFRIVRR